MVPILQKQTSKITFIAMNFLYVFIVRPIWCLAKQHYYFHYLCPQTVHWRFVLVSVHLKATNLDMSDLPKLKVNMKSS